MADSSNSDMEHECVLSITPTIQTPNKNSNSKTITEEVYKIIKENYGLFPVYFPKELRKECEVQCTEFDINYEQDVYMIFTCRFASGIEQRKFLMCVNNGRLTKIFTKFGESISIAMDMGLDLTANLILYANSLERQKSNHTEKESSHSLSNPTAKEDRNDVLSDHMTHCKEVSTEMQTSNQVVKKIGKTDQTEHPKQKKTIRVYVHTDPKSVSSVRLCHKTNILLMKNLPHTHFWETYILQSNIEGRFYFSIEVDYYQAGYLGILRSKQKNYSSLLSEYGSLSYVFIVLPIAGIVPFYSDALCEMLRYIVSTVSRADTREGIMQLDSMMSDTALSPFIALRITRSDLRLYDTKFVLKDMIVEDNNVFVYCYLIYHLIIDLSVLSRDYKVVVDVKKAQTILKSCSRISKNDITPNSARKVARVLQHLCKLVYKDEASLLLLMDLSYDLFGNEVFIELVDNSLDDRKEYFIYINIQSILTVQIY